MGGLAGRSAGTVMLDRGAASATQRELGRPLSVRIIFIQVNDFVMSESLL